MWEGEKSEKKKVERTDDKTMPNIRPRKHRERLEDGKNRYNNLRRNI